jgi:uncharacterized protein (DUF1501 family)
MQHFHINVLNRRSFLSTTAKAGMAAAFASLTNIPGVMKRALAEGTIGLSGKKVLFIWLRGANDALNSVIPIQDSSYGTGIRPTLAIPKDGGTNYGQTTGVADYPLSGEDSTYGFYPNAINLRNGFAALHPSLKFLADVYNAGDLALIHRVGYPRQSRSHFDSQNYWENGNPNNNLIKDGIFYRTMLEYIRDQGAAASPLTGVSIQSSLPLILRGSEAAMTNLNDPTRFDLLGLPTSAGAGADTKATNAIRIANQALFTAKQNRELLNLQYQNLEKTLGVFGSIDFSENGANGGLGNYYQDNSKTDGDTNWVPVDGNGNPLPNSDSSKGYYLFPTTNDKNGGWRRPDASVDGNKYVVNPAQQSFFTNLKAAALVLNKTSAIIAGTELGGFDTHAGQGGVTGSHPNLNRVIGWSMYALRKYFTNYADQATWNNVVVVTLSEFGRTTIENADLGTDHAEAGVMWVGGGAVSGGVYNCSAAQGWASGSGGSMFGVSGRYLSRNTDFRSVLGEIIRDHLGATQNQLNRIIPGYAVPGEHLLTAGTSSIDGVSIRGELGIV